MAILEDSPVPNQMMMMGASAMMGIDPIAMTKGWTTRETNIEYHSDSPASVPTTLPSRNPSTVSRPVTPPSRSRLPSRII